MAEWDGAASLGSARPRSIGAGPGRRRERCLPPNAHLKFCCIIEADRRRKEGFCCSGAAVASASLAKVVEALHRERKGRRMLRDGTQPQIIAAHDKLSAPETDFR